jgi:hypothetical protein
MIFIFFTLALMWHYSTRFNKLVDIDFDRKLISAYNKVLFFGSVLVLLAIIGGTINPILGYLLFLPGVFLIIATIYGPDKIFN